MFKQARNILGNTFDAVKDNAGKFGVVASTSLVAFQAQAATVIDTATKTAITGGFTDLKDTVIDLLGTGYPFIISVSVLLASPAIVKGLIHVMSRK